MSSKKTRVWLSLAAAVAFVCLTSGQASIAREGGPKIGVVNITKVYDSYKKKHMLEEDLRATREQKSRVIREKENEIKRLVEEIKLLELGSEVRKKKEGELERKQVDLRSFTQVAVGNMTAQTREIMEKLYGEVAKAVRDYGRKNGFDLIIKWENVDIKSKTMDQLLYKINQRTVLFGK